LVAGREINPGVQRGGKGLKGKLTGTKSVSAGAFWLVGGHRGGQGDERRVKHIKSSTIRVALSENLTSYTRVLTSEQHL